MARFALLALLPTALADLEKALSQDIVMTRLPTHDLTTRTILWTIVFFSLCLKARQQRLFF